MPASQTTRSTGERAATSSGSSSRSEEHRTRAHEDGRDPQPPGPVRRELAVGFGGVRCHGGSVAVRIEHGRTRNRVGAWPRRSPVLRAARRTRPGGSSAASAGRPSHGRAARAERRIRRQVLRRVRLAACRGDDYVGRRGYRPRAPLPSAASCRCSLPTSSARTLSESRDSEEVRELLSRYFDTSRRLIELYGGTVEKFIGDAVMAVWGTPTATEDDAGAGGEGRARPRRRRVRARRRDRGAGAACARGRAHRRGRRDHRRRGPGDGRGRPGQHGRADPVGGEAGLRVRRRLDAKGQRADRRLRGRGGELKGRSRRSSTGPCESRPAAAAR